MAGPGGNQDLFLVLADNALRSVSHVTRYWSLQRRHPEDRGRWLDLAHYAERSHAASALEGLVANQHADRAELRIHRVSRR